MADSGRNWFPNLTGKVHAEVAYAIQYILTKLYSTQNTSQTPIVDKNLIKTIQTQLQAQGSNPINVTGLGGVLSNPQNAKIVKVTSLPNVVTDPLSQSGTLISLNGIIYVFDDTTIPGTWKLLGALGTFLQDTHANRVANYSPSNYPNGALFWETDRTVLYAIVGGAWTYRLGAMRDIQSNVPSLGTDDTGFLFYATDLGRFFRWSGSIFENLPTSIRISTSPGEVSSSTGILLLGGGGSSPQAATGSFGDGSGWELQFGTNISGIFKKRFVITDTGKITFWRGTTPDQFLEVFTDDTTPTNLKLYSGTGSPEGVLTANVGSVYLRNDGGAGTVLYLKETGTGNTGWAAQGTSLPVVDTTSIVKGSSDATKEVRIEADGITTATVRVITMPDENITLANNSELEGSASGTTTLNGSYQDIGASLTLNKNGVWIITGLFDCSVNVEAVQLTGQLVVNGVAQTGIITLNLVTGTNSNSVGASISRVWIYTNSGSNLAKLQAKIAVATGSAAGSTSSGSHITAVFLHP